MTTLFVLFSGYLTILFSIIGYGFISSKILSARFSLGEMGISGILFVTLLSYSTNFIFAHNFVHNSLFLVIGLIGFFYLLQKRLFRKKISLILLISSALFVGLLMYKTHDDFFYYHYPYTLSLIEFKKIFGVGNLEHGFRTPSSIFYLNSLFYLPILDKLLINSGAIFFVIFSNIFFIQKIFNQLKNKKNDFILILSLFSLIFINTIFYRLSEHGTDRSALILIFILAIYYLEAVNRKLTLINFNYYYQRVLIVIILIASLKSFYLIYTVFIFTLLFELRHFLPKKNFYKKLLYQKAGYYFIFGSFIILFTNFSNTGCFIYPASFTCLETLSWSLPKKEVVEMKTWYELWSKAGASPNYRVENIDVYLSGLNWVPNWVQNHFFNKISDYLLSLFLMIIICFITLVNSKKSKFPKKNFRLFYFAILILLFEWFWNHPALRYGGFTLIALSIFVPLSLYMENKLDLKLKLKKKIIFLICLSFIFFNFKNVDRILNEYKKYGYNPFTNAHYFIDDNSNHYKKLFLSAEKNRNKDRMKFYIVLNRDLIKKIQLNK